MPELRGFNFAGGSRVIPEFVALLSRCDLYGGLHRRDRARRHSGRAAGQIEAASSLGLRRGQALRLIVVPQALRVIIPPLTNQYLNLTKNSSLAVAIGYPDLFAVFAGTTLNQTGQAIEIIAITMAVYLVISLVTSLLMNWYNARMKLVERDDRRGRQPGIRRVPSWSRDAGAAGDDDRCRRLAAAESVQPLDQHRC